MTKNIETFVGGKYIETIEYGFPELVEVISKDIKKAIKDNELPKGHYQVDAFKSIAGYSIEVEGYIDHNIKLSDSHLMDCKEKVLDIIGQYNYIKKVESFMERDRRFYNEDVNLS